jgi:hypothetical protein
MKKTILTILMFFAIAFKFPNIVLADTNFQTDINVEYKILESGKTNVTKTISIKNLKSEYFPKQYVLFLKGVSPENIKAYERGTLLNTKYEKKGNDGTLIIDFYERSVGKGNTKTFIVSFEDNSLTRKTGEVWEVVLPKVADSENYNTYKAVLSVPDIFGEEAYISPEPTSFVKIEERKLYKYDYFSQLSSGATAGFGIFQVFSFTLSYHLENKSNSKVEGTIALPPDTSTQKMFYDNLEPKPNDVYLDVDGNWLATYKLSANQNQNIVAKGYVQVFSKPNNLSRVDYEPNNHDLLPTTYWQSDDENIKNIASSLSDIEAIYDYVVTSLTYNYDRVNDNYVRYGASYVLKNPTDALCTEFTDLFIALARAKGIPAREINGYAYSQNPSLEPLSLVSDVLHAWPEYWDDKNNVWIPVDPTWGATTGGVDFFNKFDLRHFAFVIHSENAITPYAVGTYKNSKEPLKDVIVNFANLPDRKDHNVKISNTTSALVPLFINKLKINLENNGQNALYDFPFALEFGKTSESEIIKTFLPFSKNTFEYNIPFGFFAIDSPDRISVTAGNLTENIVVDRSQAIIGQLAVFYLP